MTIANDSALAVELALVPAPSAVAPPVAAQAWHHGAARTSKTAARRLLIILNRAAGWRRRRRLLPVLTRLRDYGCALVLRETQAPGDAERFAAQVDPGAFDVVVAAGGDGTVNETINGLAHSGLPLALIPLGTANVLAAEIGLRTDPASLARCIACGEPRPITLGAANGRRFILMTGAGFDAMSWPGSACR